MSKPFEESPWNGEHLVKVNDPMLRCRGSFLKQVSEWSGSIPTHPVCHHNGSAMLSPWDSDSARASRLPMSFGNQSKSSESLFPNSPAIPSKVSQPRSSCSLPDLPLSSLICQIGKAANNPFMCQSKPLLHLFWRHDSSDLNSTPHTTSLTGGLSYSGRDCFSPALISCSYGHFRWWRHRQVDLPQAPVRRGS
jgi:hypothetical protein